MVGRVAGKIKLQSVDELLGVPEIAGTQEIELERIHSFPNHTVCSHAWPAACFQRSFQCP